MLVYTMKNRGLKLASYSHKFYSQSAEGVALLYSASSFKIYRNAQPYRLYLQDHQPHCYHICDRIWENPPYGTACAIVLQAFLLPKVIILRKSYFYSYG